MTEKTKNNLLTSIGVEAAVPVSTLVGIACALSAPVVLYFVLRYVFSKIN